MQMCELNMSGAAVTRSRPRVEMELRVW